MKARATFSGVSGIGFSIGLDGRSTGLLVSSFIVRHPSKFASENTLIRQIKIWVVNQFESVLCV